MPWGVAAAAVAAGGSVGGGMLAKGGADKQVGAMLAQIDENRRQYDTTVSRLKPYTDFGAGQLNNLSTFLSTKNPSNYIDPGYEFRLKSGTNSITNSAAANGMLQSGDTLRALEQYGQDMGSQEYGNAFNRWLQEGQFRQGLSAMGQDAAANLGWMGNANSALNSQMTTNTPFAAPGMIMGNTVAGLGGSLGNMISSKGGSGGFGNAFNKWFGGSNAFNSGDSPMASAPEASMFA